MGDLIAVILAIGSVASLGTGGSPSMVVTSWVDDSAVELPAAVAADRRRLMDAIKKASRIGGKDQPSAADFDAATVGWGRQAAHLYILPLDLEDALRRYDADHPDAKLGGPPLDFHAVDKNLVLCVGGVHDIIEETLCEYLTGLVGRKVEPANVARVVVDHLAGLPAKDRPEFVAKLVTAQKCLRSAAREASLGMVSDEGDCAKVLRRVNRIGEELKDVVQRIAGVNKEFKAAFEKCLKAADDPPRKK